LSNVASSFTAFLHFSQNNSLRVFYGDASGLTAPVRNDIKGRKAGSDFIKTTGNDQLKGNGRSN
jgi:hypothetical protein